MKQKFNLLLTLAALLILTVAAPLNAQSDANRRETVDWIVGKVREHGNFKYFFRGENEFFNARFYTGGSNCTWFYEYSETRYDAPDRGRGRKPKVYKIRFRIKDISEVVMEPVEGKQQTGNKVLYYAVVFRAFNDREAVRKRQRGEGRDRTSRVAIYIDDEEVAVRMVQAFTHAIELCNRGDASKEKF